MSEEKIIEGPNSLSQSYSIPDLQEIFRDSELEPNRSARSLTFMIENESQYLEDDSATLSFEENLTPVEMSMKILKLTPTDLEIAKREKYHPIISKQIINQSDSSVETHKAACSCSSSSDDDDDNNEEMAFFISKKSPIKKHPPDGLATVSLEIHSLPRINSSDQSTQIAQTFLNDPFDTSFSLQNHSNDNRNSQRTNDDLYLLLSKNIELLDKMCLAISSKIKNVPNDNMQKWLIFQRELECNLHRYDSNKESSVVDTSVKCLSSFVSENSNDKGLIDKSKDSTFTSFSAFNRMLSRNVTTYAYRAQVSPSRNAMRSRRTIGSITNKWTKDNSEETKIQELWNLKRYNDFTLEQDRREMCEKNNKKSKFTNYKNVAELKKSIEKNEVVRKEEKRSNEMRKQRSRVKSVRSRKLTCQEKDKTRRPRLFSAKNLPKKLSYLSQANRFNVKDQIKKINWRIDLRCHERRSPCKLTKSRYRKNLVCSTDHQRNDRFEDETLSELQNAFSHSDESERGFQLGPETNQPYPIFQMVARTLNEILKSNGWRELFQATSSSLDHLDATSEQHFPMNDEVIFCGNENISTTTVDDNINNDSRVHNEWEEIERRKAESVSLVRQLEQLLDTSRETLSAIESSSSLPAIDDTSPEVLLKRYFDRLQSDEIAQTIANWATESVDSLDSLDYPRSTLKLAARTEVSFSDNSEMEEFPANN